jgi:hypothetical protein
MSAPPTLALAMVPAVPALAQNANRDAHGARTSASDSYMSQAGNNNGANQKADSGMNNNGLSANQANNGSVAKNDAYGAPGTQPNANGGTAGVNTATNTNGTVAPANNNAYNSGYRNGGYYGGGGWGLWGLVGLIGLIGLARAGGRR